MHTPAAEQSALPSRHGNDLILLESSRSWVAAARSIESPRLRPQQAAPPSSSPSSSPGPWQIGNMSFHRSEQIGLMYSHHSEASGTNIGNGDHSSGTPNRRSKVWEYFESELVEVDGAMKAVCRYCGMKMAAEKSGTNGLRNHIKDSCRKISEDDRQRFIATFKKPFLGSFTFNPQRSRELMITWVIWAEVAFNKFEDPSFSAWMASLQPTLNCIGRQTIRNDCVGMYKRMKQTLATELQVLDSRICFTSDLWTSNQKLGYICLTAHYVDANFALQKKIISFKAVKYPHSGVAIEEAITRCMTEYGIKEKMLTITLDNTGNNKTACDLLQESYKSDLLFDGEHLGVRCCAHILNLLVQDGLTIADKTIEMTRDLIRHSNSSPGRIQAFNEIAEREGLAAKAGLVLDVPNRWNSTHAMIIEAVKYKIVLKRYAASNQELFPSDDEWTKIEAIGEYLGAFEEATRAFSADRYPTAHIFLDNVLCIHQALKNPAWQANQTIRNLARAMEDKFIKYWDRNYNMALVIATLLDPRNKLDFLEFFYQRVCSYFVDVDASISIAREWMTKYFRKYEEVVRTNGADPMFHTAVSRGNVGSPVVGKRRMHQEFAQVRTQKRAICNDKFELDAYLEDEHVRDDENFEILSWWKTNQNKYPVLSVMAQDFLAIPLSTVSSLSAFSLSGQILGDNRSSMIAETLEALVCVKVWLYKFEDNEHTL